MLNHVYNSTVANPNKLLIIFNSAFNYSTKSFFEFYKISQKHIPTLHFSESHNTWYLQHVQQIRLIIEKHLNGVDTVFTLGLSKGGYAALLFGQMYNAEIFAINPQTNLSLEFEKMCIEQDAISFIDKFNDHNKYDSDFYQLKMILHPDKYSHIHIFCGTCKYDTMHIRELLKLQKLSVIKYDTNVHSILDDFVIKTDIYSKIYERISN